MFWLILFLLLILGGVALPFVLEARRARPDPEDAPGKFADLSQGRTHYRWRGHVDGPVAVCVHGLTTPSYVWDTMVKILSLMGFRILIYDLYGRGHSDRVPGAQTPEFFNRQLLDLLADLGIEEPVSLFGYSMGGAVATAFTAAHPDRVERLILLAPAGLGHDLGKFSAYAAGKPLLGDWLFLLAGGWLLRREMREEQAGAAPEIADLTARQMQETHTRGFAPAVLSSLRHMLHRDQLDEHRAIAETDVPVLAIWGEEDTVIPLRGLGQLAQIHRDARQISVPGAGHGVPNTHPDEVQKALQDLLKEGL